jgi:hypothetical protein
MDRHAQPQVAKDSPAARRWALAPALLLSLACGCVGTEPFVVPGLIEKPTPPVTQVVAMWNNQVITGVDPTHNGAPMHGLAGRVWLFGSELRQNLLADGKLVVELYGILPGQTQPARLESWEIKKEMLNGVFRRTDGIGPGYSLSLPWPGYRPDITQVQLWVRYEPEKGVPISAINGVTLNSGPDATPVYTNRKELGNGQPVVTNPPAAAPQQVGAVPQQQVLPPQGAIQQTGAMVPAAGTPLPGAVPPGTSLPPANPPQTPMAYQPACTVQPSGAALSARQAAFQLAPQQPVQGPALPPPGIYQQPQYQAPQQQGALPR